MNRVRRRGLTLKAGVLEGGLPPHTLLWDDQFITAESAPLASPRTMEPGPGTWVITDTDNELSIDATNKLVCAMVSPAYGDPQIRENQTFARQAGRCAYFKFRVPTSATPNRTISFGWDTDATFGFDSRHIFVNASIGAGGNGLNAEASLGAACHFLPAFDTWYLIAVILRANGAHYAVKGGVYTDWKLVYTTRTSATTPLYVGRQYGNAAGMVNWMAHARGLDLIGQWATDDFYDHSNASPVANDTSSGSADGTQYLDWTAGAGETLEISFRRTDDDNRMILRCSQAGSTMKIIEVNATVETELSSVAQTFTAASVYRVSVRYVGGEVRSWARLTSASFESAVKNNITGATFNQSVAGIKVAGFATAANWQAWPYSLSGVILNEISRDAPSL